MSLRYQTEDDDVASEHIQEPAERPVPPYYTYILIAAIVVVFLVQFGTGIEKSIIAAGFNKRAFLIEHEYWLILTGAATHGGLLHVFMNCFSLYNLGRIFEVLTNRAHLPIVFFLSALGGGILSLLLNPEVPSVGASGGIIGLFGYIAVYAVRRRQFITAEFRKSLLINIGIILFLGWTLREFVDNAGHLGGFLVGALYALVQVPTDPHIDPRESGQISQFGGLAALGIYIASCGFAILLILL